MSKRPLVELDIIFPCCDVISALSEENWYKTVKTWRDCLFAYHEGVINISPASFINFTESFCLASNHYPRLNLCASALAIIAKCLIRYSSKFNLSIELIVNIVREFYIWETDSVQKLIENVTIKDLVLYLEKSTSVEGIDILISLNPCLSQAKDVLLLVGAIENHYAIYPSQMSLNALYILILSPVMSSIISVEPYNFMNVAACQKILEFLFKHHLMLPENSIFTKLASSTPLSEKLKYCLSGNKNDQLQTILLAFDSMHLPSVVNKTAISTKRQTEISQLRSILPDYGSKFLYTCLNHFDSVAETILHITENDLPSSLSKLNISEELSELSGISKLTDAYPARPNLFDNYKRIEADNKEILETFSLKTEKVFSTQNLKQKILNYDMQHKLYDDEYESDNSLDPISDTHIHDDIIEESFQRPHLKSITESIDEILFSAYSKYPSAFEKGRDANLKVQDNLCRQTGYSVEQLVGWKVMLIKDPRKLRMMEEQFASNLNNPPQIVTDLESTSSKKPSSRFSHQQLSQKSRNHVNSHRAAARSRQRDKKNQRGTDII